MIEFKKKLHIFLKKIAKTFKINQFLFFLKKPFVSERVSVTEEQARDQLEHFSPCPQGTSITKNELVSFEYDLQIVVPAYNVEKYIEECIESILKQETKYSYKIVLINDGSIDKTRELLEQYENNPKFEIIHQENRGFSGARNRGLQFIKAKYIAFVDSDDMLSPNAIENLLDTAFAYDADIVEGGFYRLESNLYVGYKHKKVKQVDANSQLKGYPWGKVFKSALFENIHFPENFWFEDSICAFMLYPKAKKAFVIPEMVYIYRNNITSITHTAPLKKKCIDTYWVTETLLKEQEQLGMLNTYEMFDVFLKQIILNYKRTKKAPIEIQKAIFVCTTDLYEKYFNQHVAKSFKELIKAMQFKDFGKYKCFCELYLT